VLARLALRGRRATGLDFDEASRIIEKPPERGGVRGVSLAKRVRQEQSELELGRLEAELRAWLTLRRERDAHGQYTTQLDAIESLVNGAAVELAAALAALDLELARGEVYEQCRLLDLRIVWLRRVWQFFRDKFDQRDDPFLGPVLRAADEVVWSCYRQVFAQAEVRGLDMKQGPAPLPFVESEFSPEAFPPELVPPGLKDVGLGGSFLRDHLNRLPIPVLRLPPACVASPWLLVLIGHEIGHHVQYRLMANLGAVQALRERMTAVVLDHGRSEQDATAWGRWSPEIFADFFSVLVMGPAALRAIVELELAKSATMLQRRPSYPAPLVRLHLLAQVADRLGLDGGRVLSETGIDAQAAAENAKDDLALVSPLVDILFALPGLAVPLQQLCAFRTDDFRRDGAVARCARALRGLEERPADTTLRGARVAASASLTAWTDVSLIEDAPARAVARARLADHTLQVIARSREEGTRASREPTPDYVGLGSQLGSALLAAGRQQLEV
jgi:hypothetical protein